VGVGWPGGQDNTVSNAGVRHFLYCRTPQSSRHFKEGYDGGYQQYMVAPTSKRSRRDRTY